MPVNAKPESVPFDRIVADALARLKETSAAAASYEVDRSRGQWIVRRASTTNTLFAADVVAEITAKTGL